MLPDLPYPPSRVIVHAPIMGRRGFVPLGPKDTTNTREGGGGRAASPRVEIDFQGWTATSNKTKQNKTKQKKFQRDLSIAEQYRVQGCDDPSGTGSVTPSQPHDIGMAIRAAVHRKYLVSIERRTIHSP